MPELDSLPEEEERASTFASITSPTVVDSLLDKFSSLDKIVRIFAYCLHFIHRSKSNSFSKPNVVDQVESHSTLLYLI